MFSVFVFCFLDTSIFCTWTKLNFGYLNIVGVEDVDRGCWKVGPIHCFDCQNQQIWRDDCSVISDSQFKTQDIHQSNEPIGGKEDKAILKKIWNM